MSDSKTDSQDPNEPSLEDILASIRKIVFENDGEAGAGGTDTGNGNTGNRNTENRDTGEQAIAAAASEIAAVESLQSHEESESIAVEAQPGEPAVREIRPAAEEVPAEEDPPEDAPSPGSQPGSQEAVAAGERPGAASAEPAGQVTAGEDDAGDPVLVLTEMIAPDGSLVRIDPAGPPVEGGPPARNEHLVQGEGPLRREMPGQRENPAQGALQEKTASVAEIGAGRENPALDTPDQRELAATLREWLDNNLPGIVDRAARDELRKLADRLEGTPATRQD